MYYQNAKHERNAVNQLIDIYDQDDDQNPNFDDVYLNNYFERPQQLRTENVEDMKKRVETHFSLPSPTNSIKFRRPDHTFLKKSPQGSVSQRTIKTQTQARQYEYISNYFAKSFEPRKSLNSIHARLQQHSARQLPSSSERNALACTRIQIVQKPLLELEPTSAPYLNTIHGSPRGSSIAQNVSRVSPSVYDRIVRKKQELTVRPKPFPVNPVLIEYKSTMRPQTRQIRMLRSAIPNKRQQ